VVAQTALFLQAGAGYIQYLSDQAEGVGKENSIPYRVLAGLRGLVTPKVTAEISAGSRTPSTTAHPSYRPPTRAA
jgi:hypothetical protein